MKILKEIWFHAVYVFYFLLTLQTRNEYERGKMKGMDCRRSETDLLGTTYYYTPGKEPERRFSTYKELRASFKERGKL